jgi:hypothetical protein
MAQASVARRRTSARKAALAAKERRSKVLAIALCAVLGAVLAWEVPHVLKRGGSSNASASPSSTTPSGTGSVPKKFPRLLLRGGSGADPFAVRSLPDLDPGIAPSGGNDPFAAARVRTGNASTPVVPATLPKRIVIGTPGAHKHLVHGWIVILASIPVGRGHGAAAGFARGVRGLGAISILNSSNRRPLRGGYWVVYAGPVSTLSRVSRLASTVHSVGYRSAYIRELYRYR